MRARTGLWEPRVGNDPGPPGPNAICIDANSQKLDNPTRQGGSPKCSRCGRSQQLCARSTAMPFWG